MKTMRKVALQIGAPALLALMAWNAYLAVSHLIRMQKTAALTLESSTIQAEISSVLQDFVNMETGQRGFLLTDDPLYLQPYTEAKSEIGRDLASLRLGVAHRPENERLQVSELESLAKSKQAEMERSINLRQQGYRRRAFRVVDSNEGMEYMDKARGLLSGLATAESSRFAKFDRDRKASLIKALSEIIVANLCLLLLTAGLISLVRYHGRGLEQEAGESRQELVARDVQLEKLTSALSNQARSNTFAIEANANLLLENYGGFLPRQGHEYAEQIREASAQMERLRQDLVGCQGSNGGKAA